MPEKPRKPFPKWVEGQLCKDADSEKAVLDGGKSASLPTMTKPKAVKRRDGRKI